MTRRLRLDPRHAHYDLAGEAAAFVSEDGVRTVPGRGWRLLLERMNGPFTLEQLQVELAERIPPAQVAMMVRLLLREGIVVNATDDAAPPLHVALVALAGTDATPTRDVLALGGIACVDDAELAVVLTDDYLRPELRDFNRQRLHHRRPWLLAKIAGEHAWVGPLFVPSDGPCWECFAARWNEREHARRYVSRVAHGGALIVPPLLSTPATRVAALASIPATVERFVRTGVAGAAIDTIETSHFEDGARRSHRLVRRPQCPACGDPALGVPKPVVLPLEHRPEHRARGRAVDEAMRVTGLQQTWERLEHHVSPVTGITDALVVVSREDLAHTWGSRRFDTEPIDGLRSLLQPRIHDDWGKGADPLQAKVGALAETLERYSLMAERPADATRAALSALGDEAVDPRTHLYYSDAQYARPTTDRHAPHFDRVPRERFDPDRVIGWTWGRCLTDQRPCLIASDYCWISAYGERDAHFCFSDTNGCAAGPDLERAILHGLFELVERDSVALWWYSMARRPRVDVASFGDALVDAIRADHRSRWERELWVLDITSDVGIPVFAAVSARAGADRPEFVFGFGCHADPAEALRGAVNEAVQLFTVQKPFLTLPGRDAPWTTDRPVVDVRIEDWLRRARRADHPYLLPIEGAPPRRRADFAAPSDAHPRAILDACVERLRGLGISTYAVDMTRPDVELPVARVLAPGLRHFWRQLGPGRLYDAPVAMGWIDRPLAEHELNPSPMYI